MLLDSAISGYVGRVRLGCTESYAQPSPRSPFFLTFLLPLRRHSRSLFPTGPAFIVSCRARPHNCSYISMARASLVAVFIPLYRPSSSPSICIHDNEGAYYLKPQSRVLSPMNYFDKRWDMSRGVVQQKELRSRGELVSPSRYHSRSSHLQ